jgi:hypothetical protein
MKRRTAHGVCLLRGTVDVRSRNRQCDEIRQKHEGIDRNSDDIFRFYYVHRTGQWWNRGAGRRWARRQSLETRHLGSCEALEGEAAIFLFSNTE